MKATRSGVGDSALTLFGLSLPGSRRRRVPAVSFLILPRMLEGDAPAHSIAAALFLNRDEIHFANSIGYFHLPFLHCPLQENNPTCACDSGHQDAFGESGSAPKPGEVAARKR